MSDGLTESRTLLSKLIAGGAFLGDPTSVSILRSRILSALTAGVLLAFCDILAGSGQSLASLLAGLGVVLLGGFVFGGLWATLTLASRRLPTWLVWVPWCALACGFCFLLAKDLRAIENLGTRYHHLGLVVLVGCAAAAAGLTVLAALLQPARKQSLGWLLRRTGRIRLTAALVLFALGILFVWIDRKQFPGAYEFAHVSLRTFTFISFSAGLLLTKAALQLHRKALWGGLSTALLLVAWSFIGLSTASGAAASERPFVQLHLDPLRTLLDFDGDGYSHLLGGGDCAPLNPVVNPGAREVPSNGIDDNCLGGDAQDSTGVSLEVLPLPSSPAPIDIILISVDTLRADRMSAYGYERNTTPRIEEFARDASRFDSAYATSGWTSLSMPSLLRGLYPRRLSWEPVYETSAYRYVQAPLAEKLKPGEVVRARFLMPISDEHVTVGDLLRRRGMKTSAVVDGGFTEVLAARWGADRGFDEFLEVKDGPAKQRNDVGTARAAIRVLQRLRKDAEPFFLWVHFFGPHAPNSKHRGVKRFGSSVADGYDHELIYLDRAVGSLLDAVDEPASRGTGVILSSDHGEAFFNSKSRGHGLLPREDIMRVPLIVRAPGYPATQSSQLASNVDIVPTILALTETPGPKLDGQPLSVLLEPNAGPSRLAIFEGFTPSVKPGSTGLHTDLIVGFRGDQRYVQDRIRRTRSISSRRDPDKTLPFVRDAPVVLDINRYLESTRGVQYQEHAADVPDAATAD